MEELDPLQKVDLAMLRAEHQKRFQTMITYLKQKIGEGIEYRNAVAIAVISEQGAYYQLTDLPEEFAGAAGDDIEHSFLTTEEALKILSEAASITRNTSKETTRHYSLLALYSRRGIIDRKNCYLYDFRSRDDIAPPVVLEIGSFRPEQMPLFFKIKADSAFAARNSGVQAGISFCLANAGDRHLLVHIPYSGDQVTDLSESLDTTTIQ